MPAIAERIGDGAMEPDIAITRAGSMAPRVEFKLISSALYIQSEARHDIAFYLPDRKLIASIKLEQSQPNQQLHELGRLLEALEQLNLRNQALLPDGLTVRLQELGRVDVEGVAC